MKEKHIFTLRTGEHFGEIALMSKEALRTCSVKIATEDTKLLEISKEAFDKFVGEYKTEAVKATIQFYKKCKLFHSIPEQKKIDLSTKSFTIRYPSNTVILKQGDVPYNIYFVAQGSVRILRRIRDPDNIDQEQQLRISNFNEDDNSSDQIGTTNKEYVSPDTVDSKLYQIAVLSRLLVNCSRRR